MITLVFLITILSTAPVNGQSRTISNENPITIAISSFTENPAVTLLNEELPTPTLPPSIHSSSYRDEPPFWKHCLDEKFEIPNILCFGTRFGRSNNTADQGPRQGCMQTRDCDVLLVGLPANGKIKLIAYLPLFKSSDPNVVHPNLMKEFGGDFQIAHVEVIFWKGLLPFNPMQLNDPKTRSVVQPFTFLLAMQEKEVFVEGVTGRHTWYSKVSNDTFVLKSFPPEMQVTAKLDKKISRIFNKRSPHRKGRSPWSTVYAWTIPEYFVWRVPISSASDLIGLGKGEEFNLAFIYRTQRHRMEPNGDIVAALLTNYLFFAHDGLRFSQPGTVVELPKTTLAPLVPPNESSSRPTDAITATIQSSDVAIQPTDSITITTQSTETTPPTEPTEETILETSESPSSPSAEEPQKYLFQMSTFIITLSVVLVVELILCIVGIMVTMCK